MQQLTEEPEAGTEGTRCKTEQPTIGLDFLKRLFEVRRLGNIKNGAEGYEPQHRVANVSQEG